MPTSLIGRAVGGLAVLLIATAAVQAQPHSGSCGGLSTKFAPSRSSGFVPLAVFFDATGTSSTRTKRPFHDLEYRWDFGDPESGNWGDAATGSGGSGANASRNRAQGPLAAHVFERPGTYAVTVTAFDGEDTCTTTASITARAWPKDSSTVCVSPSGKFTGCPANAARIVESSFIAAMQRISSSRKRLLFRCGESWTVPAGAGYAISTNGPGMVGAYNDNGAVTASNGSCTKPRVVGPAAGKGAENMLAYGGASPVDDWRISDIEFDGQGNGANGGVATTGRQSGTNRFLFLRLRLRDLTSPISLDTLTKSNAEHAIVDTTITGWRGGGGIWSSLGARIAIMGNAVHDPAGHGEHAIRFQGPDKLVISHNSVRNAGSASRGSKENITVRKSEYSREGARAVVLSDNRSEATGSHTYALMAFSTDVSDVVIERNFFRHGTAGSGVRMEGSGGQSRFTIRNNVFDGNSGINQGYVGIQFAPSLSTIDGAVYHNTFYTRNPAGSYVAVLVGKGVTNTVVSNNLAYAPNLKTSATFMFDSGVATRVANNSSDAQMRGACPKFPDPACAKLAAGPMAYTPVCTDTYPCAQGATTGVPVWSDFFGKRRRPVRDLGAVDH